MASPYILVVDAEMQLGEVAGVLLRHAGYEVEIVTSGKHGLACAGERRPDLVVVDLMTPSADGIGMIRSLRADPALASIPALLMTSQAENVVRGQRDVVLVKPFSLVELLSVVAELTR